ncbi:hypothetical protein [Billgrantia gudaonensis]|uniref:Uncharacterized protein n=1 Tax=Billgrantia gudaonensis TaxID=376427 RepID=A0A1G8Y7M0_9GAMM|nr:hypothetical protein [Halomonas gudaonensis]SDJ98796.1 hypothetical protein SAMN04487954_11027 [Halomonas gudaonensis]
MAANKTGTTGEKDESQQEIRRDAIRAAEGLAFHETVQRFGSANAEYIKGYRGVDHETGKRFAKGLAGIAKHKVSDDPRWTARNIKQQAGYSAEVATTSRDNAEAIISKSNVRTSRSDDLPEYGKNHNVVDRVKLVDGNIVDGSQAQMKFVGDRNQLLEDIAREDGKFSRYRGTKIELPREQFEGNRAYVLEEAKKLKEQAEKLSKKSGKADQANKLRIEAAKLEERAKAENFQAEPATDYCRRKAHQRRYNAEKAEAKGNSDAATKLRREADNYDELAEQVSDSGLTTEEAIFYRERPGSATFMDIGRTSHRAGIQGAKYGAIIGGSISILVNCLAVAQGEKEASDIFSDIATDTIKAGALGYGGAFAGSAIKGGMQQSGNPFVRQLAGTSAPTLALNICLSLGSSVQRFVTGEINEEQLLTEVGEKGAGMLSSGMMAAVGQVAIPVPFAGAAIGGLIGYMLSSMFYQSALDAAHGAQISRERLLQVRAIEAAARDRIDFEKEQLEEFVSREIPQLRLETKSLLSTIGSTNKKSLDEMCNSINHYAELLGKKLQFQSIDEFELFMSTDDPLAL